MSSPDRVPGVPLERWGARRAVTAVLTVHGRGQNPDVMKEYSTRFAFAEGDGVAFFAPRAEGDTWYPESFLVPMEVNDEGVRRGMLTLDRCLEQLVDDGFAPGNIVLWGFSQGACLLSQHLLIRRPSVAAAILFTGGFIGEQAPDLPPGPQLSGLPVVLRSIEDDPFVPPWRVRETAVLLRSLGAEIDLRIDPGDQHVITDEAYSSAAACLLRRGADR